MHRRSFLGLAASVAAALVGPWRGIAPVPGEQMHGQACPPEFCPEPTMAPLIFEGSAKGVLLSQGTFENGGIVGPDDILSITWDMETWVPHGGSYSNVETFHVTPPTIRTWRLPWHPRYS